MEKALNAFLEEWNNPSPTILVHTSGSTGTPKPLMVEKQRMLNSARITCDYLDLHPGDTALLCMPLDYIAGKMMVVRSIERHLHLYTVTPSNHPLAVLSSPSLSLIAMVPSQLFATLQVPEERATLLRARNIIIGGGAITPELQQAINHYLSPSTSPSPSSGRDSSLFTLHSSLFTHHPSLPGQGSPLGGRGRGSSSLFSTYGMTETLSHIALRRLNGPDASEWYTPFDTVTLTTTPDGCLIIHAPLVHDGPLTTNDIVELRPDPSHPSRQQFRVIGRKDNIICSGGIKLQIEKIEDQLRPYLPVPFCITKRPDAQYGEAVVLLHEGFLSAGAISDAFSHLDRYAKPRHIISVATIPLTATGKIARKEASLLALPLEEP